jgi:hypothetical protein
MGRWQCVISPMKALALIRKTKGKSGPMGFAVFVYMIVEVD